LVVHVPDPNHPTTLPEYITKTLLNFGLVNNAPCQHGFQLRVPSNNTPITIPAQNQLILYRISTRLNINIYIFSSRSKPRRFMSPQATCSIGFFHRIDSYQQTSEYLVLAPSNPVHPVTAVTAAPAPSPPQPPTYGSPAAVFRTQRRARKTLLTKLPPISPKEKKQALESAW
jgi:hypothetical protein